MISKFCRWFTKNRFEIARALTTASKTSDAQLAVGESFEFGIAYWDPYETEEGWTAHGHYTTGCSADWIELVIESADGTGAGEGEPVDGATSGGVSSRAVGSAFMATLVLAMLA